MQSSLKTLSQAVIVCRDDVDGNDDDDGNIVGLHIKMFKFPFF